MTPIGDPVRWRWAGIVGGVAVGGAVAASGGLGRGLLLAAPLFALVTLAGVLAGELRALPPRGPVRLATVHTRRVRDYLPRALTVAVAGSLLALVALLAVTAATASPDDLGRAGRTLARQCSPVSAEAQGPYPGSFYAGPLALVLAVGVLAALVVLRRIAARGRAAEQPDPEATDARARRRAAGAVIGALGVLVLVPLIGVSLVTAGALLGVSCRPPAWTALGWALLGLQPAWLVLLGWSAVTVLAPPPAPAPAVEGEAAQRR